MRLRVLSLNVWGLPAPVGRLVEERLERIGADLPALETDVALFQEVWTEGARAQLLAAGPRAGLPHTWAPSGPAASTGGLVALSRHPIRSPSFRPYLLCGLPQRITHMDYYSGKGIGRFDVELGGSPVAIVNTHLHARYSPARVRDEYVGHRSAEVIELVDELRALSSPVVLAGDLNMRDVSPEYRLLRGMTGLVDAAAELDVRQPTSTLDNAYRAERGAVNESRIDYVMTRDGTERGLRPVAFRRVFDEPISVAGRPGAYSDHTGVMADLELGGPGQPPPRVRETSFELARLLLENGRERARRRRAIERFGAGVGIAAAGAAAFALRRRTASRRRFLRLLLAASAGLAATSAGGLLTLSERFVPDELADFERIEALLDRIEAHEAQRAAEPREAAISLR
jgi:endonuclease/exonuclease/phosphatase family metal-dependent hydrolase